MAVGDVHASVTTCFRDHGQQLERIKESILKAFEDILDDTRHLSVGYTIGHEYF